MSRVLFKDEVRLDDKDKASDNSYDEMTMDHYKQLYLEAKMDLQHLQMVNARLNRLIEEQSRMLSLRGDNPEDYQS